jgi:hypothetical protein
VGLETRADHEPWKLFGNPMRGPVLGPGSFARRDDAHSKQTSNAAKLEEKIIAKSLELKGKMSRWISTPFLGSAKRDSRHWSPMRSY